MLSRLSVFNLAVVEKVEAEFSAGLTVLTGETGAGKSVLMGALELVLGGRADTDVIRKGAKDARVEASFSLEDGGVADRVAALLEEIGLPEMDGGELIVRRMVSADGKGRAWVNDTPVAVATLKRLGRLLVDIHGPRANQNLLEERFQRETLDAFGGIDLSGYGAAYAGLQSARARLEDLSGDIGEDELEVLRFQVDELAGAELSSDDEEISVRHAAAAHAAELAEDAQVVTEALGGDESASAILAGLQPRFHSMAKHFPLAADWAAEAEDLSLRM